jgi:hypothetical protein
MLENRRGNKQMDNQETMATPGTQDEDKQSTTPLLLPMKYYRTCVIHIRRQGGM